MNPNMRKMTLGIMISGVLLIAPAVFAEERGPMQGPGHGPGMSDGEDEIAPLAKLNLTSDQMSKLKTERLATQKERIKVMAEIKTRHLDILDEIGKDKPDMPKVEKLAQEIGTFHGQLILARAKSMVYLRSLLNSDQKKILEEEQWRYGRHGDHDKEKGKGR
jgi:Spy/CpxP family protein refolding chaperone